MRSFAKFVLLVSVVCAASLSWADLTGSSVTGSVNFDPDPTNYFLASNEFVPAGCGNSVGSNTVIIGAGTEFCFNDDINYDTADFDGSSLHIRDVSSFFGAGSFTMSFTDSAFVSISELTDTFVNGGVNASIVGNTITITWAGTSNTGTYDATFAINGTNSVPEPGSMLLLSAGAGFVGVIRRKLIG